jgi:hypothetical protein
MLVSRDHVAWTTREKLTDGEWKALAVRPLDREIRRVRIATLDANGQPVSPSTIVDEGPLVTAVASSGDAVLVREPSAEPSCGGSPAHDEVRLRNRTRVASGHRLLGCRLGTTGRASLVPRADGYVAAVSACTESGGALDAVLVVAFDSRGEPTGAAPVLVPVAHDAFALGDVNGGLVLAYATSEETVVLDRLGANLAPLGPSVIVLERGREWIDGVWLDKNVVTVQRAQRYGLDLAALYTSAALPEEHRAITPLVERCPRAR